MYVATSISIRGGDGNEMDVAPMFVNRTRGTRMPRMRVFSFGPAYSFFAMPVADCEDMVLSSEGKNIKLVVRSLDRCEMEEIVQ